MSKKIYGLIGWPVKHSLSAAMHNAAFSARKISAEYKLFSLPPEQLEGFLLGDINQEISGFNITIPYKVKAWEILSFSGKWGDPKIVELAGAINTVRRDKKEVRNTDAAGFRKSLVGKFAPENKNVLLIGCGGAGRAVMAGLNPVPAPAKVYIYENNPETVQTAQRHFENFQKNKLVEYDFKFISKNDLPQIIKDCQLLVNATPLGMKEGDSSPLDKNLLHKDLYVYDLVYNRKTQLILDAKDRSAGCSDGRGMLLYQGVEAWKFWIGQEAPVEAMRKALNKALEV